MTRSLDARLFLIVSCSLLLTHPPGVTIAKTRTETQYQLSDGLPAPLPGAHTSVFTNRVLRWHEDYCGKSRLCHESTRMHGTDCYRCAPCRCDIHCHSFGDCCPDVAMSDLSAGQLSRSDRLFQESITCESSELQLFLPVIPSGDPLSTSTQTPPSLDPIYGRYGQRQRLYHPRKPGLSDGRGDESGGRGVDRDSAIANFYMVSRCPHTFTRDSSECQNDGVLSPVSPAGYNGRGISSRDPPAVYRNQHCARCHGVYETVPWNIRVLCSRMKSLLFATPRNLTLSLALDPDCAVTFTPPPAPHHHARHCYTRPGIISSCNVTGAWRKRDSFLERACLSYVTPKTVGGKLYQNVFCFLCNHGDEDASLQLSLTACQRNPNLAITSGVGGDVAQTGSGQTLSMTLTKFDITRELARPVLFEGPGDKKCEDREVYDFKQVRDAVVVVVVVVVGRVINADK